MAGIQSYFNQEGTYFVAGQVPLNKLWCYGKVLNDFIILTAVCASDVLKS